MTESPPLPARAVARNVLIAISLVALALLLWKVAPVLMLFFAGVVFATAIHAGSRPLVRYLRLPSTLAVAVVFALLILLIAGGAYLFGKQLASQTEALVDAVTQAWGKVDGYLQSTAWGPTVMQSLQDASDGKAVSRVAKGTVTVFGGVADLVMVLFLSMYLAVNPATYRNGF